MDVALKVSCLGLCAALLAALIRKSNPETSLIYTSDAADEMMRV